MMKILFWNISCNAIGDCVAQCALEHEADIICLAEHRKVDPWDLCQTLGDDYRWIYGPNDSRSKKVILFARTTAEHVDSGQLFEQERYVLWTFRCEGVIYNIVALHMVDKRSENSAHARIHDAGRIVANLHLREKQASCENSIVVGDFNADPFEPELTTKDSFFAVMFKDVLRHRSIRKRGDEEFRMMYNPVLHFLSEETKCYGSFYWGKGFGDIYWHCFDQALVSLSLMDKVKGLQYLRTIGGVPLTQRAGPRKEISDHLPLLLTIEGGLDYV